MLTKFVKVYQSFIGVVQKKIIHSELMTTLNKHKPVYKLSRKKPKQISRIAIV